MDRVELVGAVARAIADALRGERVVNPEAIAREERAAVAAVRVVLVEATRSIEALRDAKIVGAYAIGADDALGEALAVLARLVPPSPV